MVWVGEVLNEFDFSLFLITEMWTNNEDIPVLRASLPNGYDIEHLPREERGGGVGVIFSKVLTAFKVLPVEIRFTSFEHFICKFSVSGRLVAFCILYRPGTNVSPSIFMEEFQTLLESITSLYTTFYICGDFNFWPDDPENKPYTSEFLNLIDLYNCQNLITEPTHSAGHALDLIITETSMINTVNDIYIAPVNEIISDHDLVVCELTYNKPSPTAKTIKFRNYKRLDQVKFSESLINNITEINLNTCCDNLVLHYNNMFVSLLNEYCPLLEKKIMIREDSPWCNGAVISKRRLRRAAERKWRKTKNPVDRTNYVRARDAAVAEVSSAKVSYYNGIIQKNLNDKRKLWCCMNSLLGVVNMSSLPTYNSASEMASEFNKFFLDKISTIRETIDSNNFNNEYSVVYQNYIPVVVPGVFSEFHSLSEHEFRICFESVNKTCCALDPINIRNISFAYNSIFPLLRNIVNKCLTEGIFPSSEKRAVVKPLLKKVGLDEEVLNNYRPVSNPSFLSKIIEKAMLMQLLPFFQTINVIPKFQSAYRESHSTETALCKIYNDLVENVCLGSTSLLVLLDLSAAFDTIDHQILLTDLSDMGVSGIALKLLKSYFTLRSQSVLVEGTQSQFCNLDYGVPQGSILGPILFIVYVHSLSQIMLSHGVSFHVYADDTQIYVPVNDLATTKSKLTNLLSDIRIWMKQRKLKLNEGKTEVMLVKGSLRTDIATTFGTLSFGNTNLMLSNVVRNIGVHFDSNLSFDRHIDGIVRACNFQIRNLYFIRKYLSRENLIELVHAFVISKIDYCNVLFIGLPKKQLKKLQKVLNRAVRLICSLGSKDHVTPSLITLHWLPIKARVEFKVCLLVFKILKFNQPQYLSDLIHLAPNNFNLTLRSNDDVYRLEEPRAIRNKKFGERSFKYVAPRMYNALPLNIRKAKSVDVFKTKLKTHIFQKAFNLDTQSITPDYAV